VLLLWIAACAPDVELSVTPASLDFGDVDFAVEMPEEGYDPLEVSVTNIDKDDHEVWIVADDPDHLCVQGFPDARAPYLLGTVPDGASYDLSIAVCAYDPGDRDSEYAATVAFATETDSEPVAVDVVFVPIRTIEE
jgi:hypothetical protein